MKIYKGIELINSVKKEPNPIMIWNGIPEGSTGLITGVAKTGKTTFAENLGMSIAVGKTSLLGYPMDGKPRKVLFLNLEESWKLKARRNLKQIKVFSDKEQELFSENYMVNPDNFPQFLNSKDEWSYMSNYIDKSECEVLILDSLSHMMIGKIEDSQYDQMFIQNFGKYLKSKALTTMVVHHNVKGNDKPMNQDSIAGSRFISQEFEYAHGFANIPNGGNYHCMLYNKHIEKDDTKANLYRINSDGWLDYLSSENKNSLYYGKKREDGRRDDTNVKIVYDYILNQTNQGNQAITAKQMKSELVTGENSIMSNDTLFQSVGKLRDKGLIEKEKRGTYILIVDKGMGSYVD